MPIIKLTTVINAPIGRCFDLARSIDLRKLSTAGTDEEAIAGVTSGLIGAGQHVTWKAKHFGIRQKLTSTITQFEYPCKFRDEMVEGAFKIIRHDHLFEESQAGTIMRDDFRYESPGGILGQLFNRIVLHRYLLKLLEKRNAMIKTAAESDPWKELLTPMP